jgi:metal-responsive CopG/Arc/MetJ family transcriptional regulator
MTRVNVKISLPPDLLEAVDKVADLKDRTRSAQIKESLQMDPDIYEVLEGMKNE